LNVQEAIDLFSEKSYIVSQTNWIANKERAATATDYAIKSSTFVQTGITHVALLPFDGETWQKAEGKGNRKIKVGEELTGSVSYWLRNAGSAINNAGGMGRYLIDNNLMRLSFFVKFYRFRD